VAVRRLAWDAPNVDMQIASILGHRPTPQDRPDFDALGRWFVAQAPPGVDSEAAVFVNVPEAQPERLLQWLTVLVSVGYRVFAKPKIGDSDVDDDMVRYLTAPGTDEALAEVVVVSHDSAAFLAPLEELAGRGVAVTVLAFAEYAGGLRHSELLDFIDLGDVPRLFSTPLPRMDLTGLPPEGRWFEPRGRLGGTPRT